MLLAAALLKGYQLATEPVAETGLFNSRWFLIAVVEFELFFGLWLLSGLYPSKTRIAALACFLTFAGVSLSQAMSGEASCGCFGKVPVSPWYTFVFHLVAIMALWYWRPSVTEGPSIRSLRLRFSALLVAFSLVGIPTAFAIVTFTPAVLNDDGDLIGDSQVVVLDPASWEGRRFTLLPHIDAGASLSRGQWIVVLHRHNCPPCQEAIPQYMQAAYEFADQSGAPRVALVEVPPHLAAGPRTSPSKSVCLHGRLSDTRSWRVATPTFVRLQDGVATRVTEQPETLEVDPIV